MSDKQKHSKSYSASDIRNYLEGKLSPAEMHAMEKAAMDDPLLSDALEGMELSNRQQNISFESDTEELEKRLQERIKQQDKNRIFPFILKWRAAAAVLLLAVAGTLSYFFLIRKPDTGRNISLMREKNKITDTFMQNDLSRKQEAPPDTNSTTNPLHTSRDSRDTVSPAFHNKSVPNQLPVNKGEAKDIKGNAAEDETKEPITPEKAIPEQEPSSVARAESKEFSTAIPIDKNTAVSQPAPAVALKGKAAGVQIRGDASFNNQNPANFKKQDKADRNFYLQGTVADSNGIPIPSATVTLKRTKEAVSTDINGMFKVKTVFPDSNQNIVVNSVGYQPVSVTINPAENKDRLIRLPSAGNSLADVVVVGYGVRKREIAADEETPAPVQKKTTMQKAEPLNGWPAYNAYINKNKKINTSDSLLKGIEIVSFVVNKNGELSSFKIEKSVSPAHDAEVIRLIKEGAGWKLLKGNKHRCRLTVDFE